MGPVGDFLDVNYSLVTTCLLAYLYIATRFLGDDPKVFVSVPNYVQHHCCSVFCCLVTPAVVSWCTNDKLVTLLLRKALSTCSHQNLGGPISPNASQIAIPKKWPAIFFGIFHHHCHALPTFGPSFQGGRWHRPLDTPGRDFLGFQQFLGKPQNHDMMIKWITSGLLLHDGILDLTRWDPTNTMNTFNTAHICIIYIWCYDFIPSIY